MKKEYLNEEEYQKNNKKVRKVGKILLIVGISILIIGAITTILGFLNFGNTSVNMIGNEVNNDTMKNTFTSLFGSMGLIAIGGIIDSIGFTLTIAGGITMIIGHKREITAYTTQQVMPVAQEGIEKMAPTIGNAAKEITKGIKEGLKDE